jgi:hypothetical protein
MRGGMQDAAAINCSDACHSSAWSQCVPQLGIEKFAALLNRFADLADVQARSCTAATHLFRIARHKPIVQFHSATDHVREYFHLVMRIASQSSSQFS